MNRSGKPAFGPVYAALVELAKKGHQLATTQEIGKACNRTADSVSNALGYHIREAEKAGEAPAVVRVQRGVFRLAKDMDDAKIPAPRYSKKTDSLFEKVWITPKGTIIVRGDVTDTLYKLEEVDL